MLQRRGFESNDSLHQAMDEAGGLYIVRGGEDLKLVHDAVVVHGVRGLEVHPSDVAFLRDLPLEFLVLFAALPVEPVNTLHALRGLHLDTWTGRLDLDALPRLEWFGATELEHGQLDALCAGERPNLHHLTAGRYRYADATPLRRLTTLTHLAIGDSRALTSLRGVASLPMLTNLSVYLCRHLDSIAELVGSNALRHVDIDRCNRITDLSPLADLPELRSLQIEARTPPSLAPLVDHPGLEFVWIVSAKAPDDDVVHALLRNPGLRFLIAGRWTWLRSDDGWVHIPDIYSMNEAETALYRRSMSKRSVIARW